MPAWVILLIILGIVILWFLYTYNSLVRWRIHVKNAWSQIDVQLKRRHDLIPNLVELVKGYAKHEKEVFENVARARARCFEAKTKTELADAEERLSEQVHSLLAIAENYPELKANENFKLLHEEIVSTENKIAFARQFYNDTVSKYNSMIVSIPTVIVASSFAFRSQEFFRALEEERRAVRVKF
jgi:LemA protein